MEEKIDIARLNREQLSTPAYRQLIQSLFVAGDVDKRLRYSNWAFVENPALMPDEDPPIYLSRVGSKNVGQLAVIPVEIVLAGERVRAGWAVDMFVSPNFQRRGIGIKLWNAAFIDFPVLMSIGQTDASFQMLHTRLNWIFNGNRLTIYKSFLRKRLAVKYAMAKFGLFKGGAAKVVPVNRFNLPSGESFETVDSFENCPDVLRGQNIEAKDIGGILRTAKYLEWRYLKHPYIKYNISKITLSCSTCIHVIWRVLERDCWSTAVIVDVMYSRSVTAESMSSVLDVFQQCITEMGLEIIECQTTDTLVLQGFRDNGLSRREPGKRFLYGTGSMETCPVIENGQWKLYAGDCDVEALDF